MTEKHNITRECDEYCCTCGIRWGVDEVDPHNKNQRHPTGVYMDGVPHKIERAFMVRHRIVHITGTRGGTTYYSVLTVNDDNTRGYIGTYSIDHHRRGLTEKAPASEYECLSHFINYGKEDEVK